MSQKLITILGPTACGKTKLAVQLCSAFNGEIISADSRQVYTGMDIGTGKDLADYDINNTTIPYHLINIVNPKEEYNLYFFQKDFINAFNNINLKKKQPFLVGGTGMYLSAILQGYELTTANFNNDQFKYLNTLSEEQLKNELLKLKPVLHNTTDLITRERIIKAIIINKSQSLNDVKLVGLDHFIIGIALKRDLIKQRIKTRLKKRFEEGMIEEVKRLLDDGLSHNRLQLFGLEYKFISRYLLNELNYNDMFQKLNSAINEFAKKQMTWFRKMEKEGIVINWIDEPFFEKAKAILNKKLIKYK